MNGLSRLMIADPFLKVRSECPETIFNSGNDHLPVVVFGRSDVFLLGLGCLPNLRHNGSAIWLDQRE